MDQFESLPHTFLDETRVGGRFVISINWFKSKCQCSSADPQVSVERVAVWGKYAATLLALKALAWEVCASCLLQRFGTKLYG